LFFFAKLYVFLEPDVECVSYDYQINKKKYFYGKEQLFNIYGKMGPKVDRIYSLSSGDDSLVVYENQGFGFLNVFTGKEVIKSTDHQFIYAFPFYEGLAAVVNDSNKLGFISLQGSFVIPPTILYSFSKDISEIGFRGNFCIIPFFSTRKGTKYGLLNRMNQFVLAPEFDFIGEPESEYNFRSIMSNKKYGLVDSVGAILVQPVFDEIIITKLGIIFNNGVQQYLTDFKLNTLSKFAFDNIRPLHFFWEAELNENLYAEEKKFEFSKKFAVVSINFKDGILNTRSGKIIIRPEWDNISYFRDGLFNCQLQGKHFVVDSLGNYIN